MRKKIIIGALPSRHARLRKLGPRYTDARGGGAFRRKSPRSGPHKRTTLVKIEKGDPGVAIGSYASSCL